MYRKNTVTEFFRRGGLVSGKNGPSLCDIIVSFPSGTRGDACNKKCFRYRTIYITKTETGANGKDENSGRIFIFARRKIKFKSKKCLYTYALNLIRLTFCTFVKTNLSSCQDLFLVTHPTGLNCRRSHSLLVPVVFPMAELDPSLFSLF